MQTDKRPVAVHDDRLGGPRPDTCAHNTSVRRAAGSPSQSEQKTREASDSVFRAKMPAKRSVADKASPAHLVSTKRFSSGASLSGPWAQVGETLVWQSPSGATASMVVTFDELPRPYLWNENDENRNPGETQPRAIISPTTQDGRETRWLPFVPEWLEWLVTDKGRSENTREAYEPRVRKVLGRVGKSDLRDITYRDVRGCLSVLESADGGWQPNTRNGYVAALRSFWRYLIDKCDLDQLGVPDIGRKLDKPPLEGV